jgi:hypothetical protein
MVWLFLLLGLLLLFALIGRPAGAKPAAPRRKRDKGGSGIVMLDGAPIIGPDDSGLGLSDGHVQFDDIDDGDDPRFRPGGGSGGGAGATGSWDDDGGDD